MRAIRTEEDYEAALARLEEIFDAEESTSEEEEFNILVDWWWFMRTSTIRLGLQILSPQSSSVWRRRD